MCRSPLRNWRSKKSKRKWRFQSVCHLQFLSPLLLTLLRSIYFSMQWGMSTSSSHQFIGNSWKSNPESRCLSNLQGTVVMRWKYFLRTPSPMSRHSASGGDSERRKSRIPSSFCQKGFPRSYVSAFKSLEWRSISQRRTSRTQWLPMPRKSMEASLVLTRASKPTEVLTSGSMKASTSSRANFYWRSRLMT